MSGNIINVILAVIYMLLVVNVVFVVVLEKRQPVKTIAWIMVLVFLPVVGLLAYFFFGRNSKRQRFVSRACSLQLAKRSVFRFYRGGFPEIPAEHEFLIRLFKRQNAAFPFSGNHIQMFTQGEKMLSALISDIESARHHIHMEFYIIEDDRVGRMVRDALVRKAAQGVKVRFVYDDVGCWNVSNRFFMEMQEAGIEVAAFLPVRFPELTSKVDYRNHRKIVVIDGIIGYAGGMNLAERYFYDTSKGKAWRDTHLRIIGNAVAGLQRAFLTDWYVASGSLLTEQLYFPQEDEQRMKELTSDSSRFVSENALVQIVTSIPTTFWTDITQGLVMSVLRARRYCYMQSPYFIPNSELLFALQTAALAGVDVRLMIPERADSRLLTWASRSYLSDVMKAGVRVYLYKERFLHSKTMVADDSLFTCGSANLDFRSLEHNFEVNAFVYDKKMAQKMRQTFLSDQENCRLLNLSSWEGRSLWRHIIESFIRLLTPLL